MLHKAGAWSRPLLFGGLPAIAVVLAFGSIVHPYGTPKKSHEQGEDLKLVTANREVAAIIARSCANCHSERTKWPWYSYVPPASWLVEKDVAEARSQVNWSRWASYSSEDKSEILADIARVVAHREMPLRQYLLLHRDARLSDGDAHLLVRWAVRERRALQTSGTIDSESTSYGGSR